MKSEFTVGGKPLRPNTKMEWLPGGGVRVTKTAQDGFSATMVEYTPEEAKAMGLWEVVRPFKPEDMASGGQGDFVIAAIDRESRTVTLEPSK